jgi:hypothetical protein
MEPKKTLRLETSSIFRILFWFCASVGHGLLIGLLGQLHVHHLRCDYRNEHEFRKVSAERPTITLNCIDGLYSSMYFE